MGEAYVICRVQCFEGRGWWWGNVGTTLTIRRIGWIRANCDSGALLYLSGSGQTAGNSGWETVQCNSIIREDCIARVSNEFAVTIRSRDYTIENFVCRDADVGQGYQLPEFARKYSTISTLKRGLTC